MTAPKIATCCYCGTRATLVLKGTERHELACSNCGAPLHDLKMLRTDRDVPRDRVKRTPRKPGPVQPAPPAYSRKPQKRRKSLKRKIFEEAWDFIEDIFD